MKKIILALLLCAGLYADEVYATFVSEGVKEADLKLNSSGIVDEIKVDIGSRVKKGDILLKIRNNTQVENVNIQKANVEATEQTYLFNKKQYERYEKTKNVVDQNTYDSIYFTYTNSQSTLNVNKATLKYHEEVLADTYLRAPFDGVIADKTIEVGDGVTQNSTTLFKLISNDIKIVIEFDSRYASKVKVGDVYSFSVDGSQNKQEVKITKIYPSVDVNTRKLKAEALVKDMMSGVFGDGTIRTK